MEWLWRRPILWNKSQPQHTPQRVRDEHVRDVGGEDSGFSLDYSGEGQQGLDHHSFPQEAWAGPSRQAHIPQAPSFTLPHILSSTSDRRQEISPSHPRLTNSGVAANEDIVLDKDASVSERGVSAQAPQQYRAEPSRLRAAQPPSDRYNKRSPAAGHTEARGRVKLIMCPSAPQRISAENTKRVDENMSEGVASDEVMSATVISGDDDASEDIASETVASDIVLDGVYRTTSHKASNINRPDSESYNESDDGVDSDSAATTTMGLEKTVTAVASGSSAKILAV
ncbi:hypothetical protein JB92DRAFT_2870136, partial [Gautieria morchelliformis]